MWSLRIGYETAEALLNDLILGQRPVGSKDEIPAFRHDLSPGRGIPGPAALRWFDEVQADKIMLRHV